MKLTDLNLSQAKAINKGWSNDQKYYIQAKDQAYLIRTSSLETLERKKKEYAYQLQLTQDISAIPKPLDIRVHDQQVEILYDWQSGQDANNILPTLSRQNQYDLGYQAGQILKQIHQIPAPQDTEDWAGKYAGKIDRNLQRYNQCPVKYKQGNLFVDYVEAHRHLIENRPQTFQHGDYHTRNMVLSQERQLGIIDFNRWSWGDPWEEFNRIDFSSQVSPDFATGQIQGYFNGHVPDEFFPLMLLYIACNALNALPWALAYSDREVAVMQEKAQTILTDYANLSQSTPSWYGESLRYIASRGYDKMGS